MRRFRRLRANPAMRRMVCETRLNAADFIYPIFVAEGNDIMKPVDSMPTVYQYSIDNLEQILPQIAESGISGLLIFGIPEKKDELATEAYNDKGVTQQAIRYIKEHYPDMLVIADVCLCEYTSHGHCGVVKGDKILNDSTLPLLCKMAVSLAKAGADTVQNLLRDIILRSVTPQNLHHALATESHIRWILATDVRLSVR